MVTATLNVGDRVELNENADEKFKNRLATVEYIRPSGMVYLRVDGVEASEHNYVYENEQGVEVRAYYAPHAEFHLVEQVEEQHVLEAGEASLSPEALAHMERRNAFQEELGRLVNVLNDLGDVTISSWELTGNKHDQFVFSMEFQTHKEAN